MDSKTPNIVKVDRGTFGRCNICLKQKDLSWEHIIPEAAFYYEDVEMKTINQHLHGKNMKYYPRFSQNGVKLRTVCRDCNSEMGLRFDRALISILEKVKKLGEAHKNYPEVINVKCRPNALIRSLVSHLLASKIEIDFSKFENESRRFVCDLDKPIPESFNIFYWAYPYKNVSIIRDLILQTTPGFKNINLSTFQIFKCYPLAFLLTDSKEYGGLFSLNDFKNVAINHEANIPLKLLEKKHPAWPENTPSHVKVFGQAAINSITAIERKR